MLLDTSGLLCCLDSSEKRHQAAVRLYSEASRRLTHNYVLAVFFSNTPVHRVIYKPSLQFVTQLANDADIEMVWVDRELHDAGLKLLQAQSDKAYSLCDAVSMALMKREGIMQALTTDRHFEQAGFDRLLDG